jgi:hypothetical protein
LETQKEGCSTQFHHLPFLQLPLLECVSALAGLSAAGHFTVSRAALFWLFHTLSKLSGHQAWFKHYVCAQYVELQRKDVFLRLCGKCNLRKSVTHEVLVESVRHGTYIFIAVSGEPNSCSWTLTVNIGENSEDKTGPSQQKPGLMNTCAVKRKITQIFLSAFKQIL